jgi:hypothetical protein
VGSLISCAIASKRKQLSKGTIHNAVLSADILLIEKCGICGVPLHNTNTTNDWKVPCFFPYHNTSFFGLCKEDWRQDYPIQKGKFTIPADDAIARHA